MIVALDANIWIKEHLLRSGAGAAFLHVVRRMQARVLLPSVTRDEVVAGVTRMGLEAVTRVDVGFATIQSLTGSRPEYEVPSEVDFRNAAKARIEQLDALLLIAEVTLEQHEHALARLHEHRAPSSAGREQYRDCLLWESLAGQDDPERTLISADKDFRDKDSAELAAVLREECGRSISFFTSLEDYLRQIEPQTPPLDENAILEGISHAIQPILDQLAGEYGCRLGDRTDSTLELYATEDPHATAAVFTLRVAASDLHIPNGTTVEELNLVLTGSCLLREEDNQVTNLAMTRVEAETPEGVHLPWGIVYLSGSATFGVHQVPYSVRTPIPRA